MAKIGLDIGHGTNTFPPDKGVYKKGVGYEEHDANSRVAAKLEAKLKAAGHTVFKAQQPGKNDVDLNTRTDNYFANKVDLIISCHANANGNASAHGYASFYWHNDSRAKKISDLYAEEIKAQGFDLWGGSRPSMPGNDWSNFHMCRIPAQRGIPSILVENGFMTNSGDFEWIFGSKKDEYAEKCATAAFNAIQRYLGKSIQKGENTLATKTTKNPQVETGGLSYDNITKVIKYWKQNNWRGTIIVDWRTGNPKALSGRLSPAKLARYEKWLKAQKFYYKIIK